MNGRDWFRKVSWSADDAADFERRLSRSRGKRTQYLKLQAWHLANTKKPSLAAPAIDLARRYLQEDPGGSFEVDAYLVIAEASTTLGKTDEALQAYRVAVAMEAEGRGTRHYAYIDYAWYVATNDISCEYEAVLKAMDSMQKLDLIFPFNQYKYFGALAIISESYADRDYARRMARNALESLGRDNPLTRRKGTEIVQYVDASIQKRLWRLAA